ncbi:metabolite traffic protein EboE [Actinoplanes sp. NBRC 103695]|uniref:metabolite traffic protein EboE n=1 Tax=Actinoplanes sp. NBRC 103695 TaxID=3032202 RepID=UPI0024A48623|nr:metabolite traffic protein EboE [Actinoplanes sp. NBRC 103695]GLY99120.1 xylose isomerase [Actinoplanes sp. NBRC 103695]
MRFHHRDGQTIHLSYCTNVHAAEDLDGIVGQLDTYALPIREKLGTAVLGLGLWIAAPAASELVADGAKIKRLKDELGTRGLEVVTLNGFPYAAFQQPVVKGAVYEPDWTTPARLTYTLNLARILERLMPDDAVRGSVSTLPLAWRTPWDQERQDACRRSLDVLASELAGLDRTVRVAFEPEPGCVVENTSQAAAMLHDTDHSRLGVCLDLAHLACAWEDPSAAIQRLRAAGVPIVKVQVSAALASDDPERDAEVLGRYVEPRFLHQTRGSRGLSTDDLDDALAGDRSQPWRIHYHVPIHARPEPPLRATTGVLRDALRVLVGGPEAISDHLDVETYTWNVLPEGSRPRGPAELVAGIAAELDHARGLLDELEVKP